MDMLDENDSAPPPLPEISDAELNALMERARGNPAALRAFEVIRKQGLDVLRNLIADVMKALLEYEGPQAMAKGGPLNVRQLAGVARDRESVARHRRELAQDIVLGALVNLDNPDWDPMDPSTSKDTQGNAFISFLKQPIPPPKRGGR
jgi:hypothetical protein